MSLLGMLSMAIGYFWKLKYDRKEQKELKAHVQELTREFAEHKNNTLLDAQATKLSSQRNGDDLKRHINDCTRDKQALRRELRGNFKTIFDRMDGLKK